MFPRTYLLPANANEFKRDQRANPSKEYIVKTLYSGSRVGVDLYDDATMHQDLTTKKYAIIQEYIKNPLLINGHKFDVRFYMVVNCKPENKGVYLYKGSYNVFAEKPFDYHSRDRASKINQANADDKLYDLKHLPRTMTELKALQVPYEDILMQLAAYLQIILECSPAICNNNGTYCPAADKNYNVYGVDVEILDNMLPLIIEINSSATINFPDIPWKNELTKAMREQVAHGTYDAEHWVPLQ